MNCACHKIKSAVFKHSYEILATVQINQTTIAIKLNQTSFFTINHKIPVSDLCKPMPKNTTKYAADKYDEINANGIANNNAYSDCGIES
jgi:hypothetical protein